MKNSILSVLVLCCTIASLFAAEKEEVLDPHEKQLLEIIKTSKTCVGILIKISDEASADKYRKELNQIRVRFQVVKAKNKALGAPSKEKQLEIIEKLGKELFENANAVEKELNRIQSLPKVYEKLKEILDDLNPRSKKSESEQSHAETTSKPAPSQGAASEAPDA